ncbi:Mut7-C ubiquitin/RNAse domain-containing protein [Pontibacter vulgaris]|uniref:Mut7-C ubiquitin/RNAse domain-containing protein n=1 Tax=Pontibacter vulgaris TaxID=2905679 RepID=UPI001FA727B3|nr:Mut7-C ubiquitin/RNAse domain-containing protein [Pontibacter vulgaris]
MPHAAKFFFHGRLNDFLPKLRKNEWLAYNFDGAPAVKDAMEAIGVPHPEIGNILINGAAAGFMHPLQTGVEVEVFPAVCATTSPGKIPTDAELLDPVKFILDVHLGKLAKLLRMAGFDTLYETSYDDKVIAQIARADNRIVLTRDVGLLKHKAIQQGYWLRSQHGNEQLTEVIKRYGLQKAVQPFKRCLVCNGLIRQVEKETVQEQLPPKTKLYFSEFYQCTCCNKVYWKGSHYERMQQFLQQINIE